LGFSCIIKHDSLVPTSFVSFSLSLYLQLYSLGCVNNAMIMRGGCETMSESIANLSQQCTIDSKVLVCMFKKSSLQESFTYKHVSHRTLFLVDNESLV
jgi:hypothetical protein